MRIVILEDEVDIAEALVGALRADGHEVLATQDEGAFFQAVAEAPTDLAVLDVMLPGADDAGFRTARALRDASFGGSILFVTARDAVSDRIRGLDLGGDDYLVKPFSIGEFRARVRALLRRGSGVRASQVERGRLALDLTSRTARWDGAAVRLSEREFAMLELLAYELDRSFSSFELQERLFPDATSGAAVVRVYVRQLRAKLSDDAIRTTPHGYRLGEG